jgi:parallel beta-helix repeat protein
VANNSGGIRFEYCTNNLIINNIISSNDEFGIILFHSNGSIVGNKLSNNGENSIVISSANGNNITRNIISNNKYGIDFYVSSDNVVKENTLLNNQYAIHIWINSNNNSVCENTISENSVGISLAYVGQTSVHHNNFINNTRHVEPQEASDSAWDDGYPSGGNYWSDYVCVDLHSGPYQNQTGSDGIGDTPYTIDVDNLDNYPLMMPWGSPQAIAASVDTYPETLNLWSKDSQVTSYIELPEGYDLININVSTIVLNGTVQEMFARTPFRPRPPPPGDHNNNSIPDLEVMFNHAELVNFMVSEDITFDNVTLSLTGQLYDGTRFQGSCLMRVSALTGDVNCDGKVSLQDLQLLAGAYNSHSGDPGWNGNANFAEPWDSIGLTDLVTVAIYYGQHSP